MNLNQEISQKQTLSVFQTQSLNILTMNNFELFEFIEKEQLENPVLEVESGCEAEPFTSIGNWFHKQRNEPEPTETDEDNQNSDIGMPQGDSLRDFLRSQIPIRTFTKEETLLTQYIIDLLDENGYLTVSAEEITALTGAGSQKVQKCIHAVRQMEPAGVGAGTLCECLLLQLQMKGLLDDNLTRIISGFLNEVACGHFHKIAKQLSLSTDDIRKYVNQIHSLNPLPGSGFGSQDVPNYIIPDIILDRQGDTWEITLNDKWMGSIGISRMYENLYRHSDDENTAEYLKDKIKRAQFLVRSIEQRRDTLLKVAQVLLEKQKGFLGGNQPLAPLNLGMIAQALQIHESTVSRAIRDKYVQTPLGTHLLKNFLTTGISSCTGEQKSGRAVKEMIAQLIRSEDASKPLSDNALAAQLKQLGVDISRRTVAKYREQIKIGNASTRKTV